MKSVFAVTILSVTLCGCGRHECKNDNLIFDQYAPVSEVYKGELVKQLQSGVHQNTRYFVDKYTEINNKPFMIVYIEAEGL